MQTVLTCTESPLKARRCANRFLRDEIRKFVGAQPSPGVRLERHVGRTDRLSLRKPTLALIAAFGNAVFLAGHALTQEKSIVVASTTSTKDSGLFEYLLPRFTLKTGMAVKVLAVGTGQALDIARRGDADVVFVRSKIAEQQFVAEGHGVKRNPVMNNDFVLIGPKSDPAGIKGMTTSLRRLRRSRIKPQPLFRAATTQ